MSSHCCWVTVQTLPWHLTLVSLLQLSHVGPSARISLFLSVITSVGKTVWFHCWPSLSLQCFMSCFCHLLSSLWMLLTLNNTSTDVNVVLWLVIAVCLFAAEIWEELTRVIFISNFCVCYSHNHWLTCVYFCQVVTVVHWADQQCGWLLCWPSVCTVPSTVFSTQ